MILGLKIESVETAGYLLHDLSPFAQYCQDLLGFLLEEFAASLKASDPIVGAQDQTLVWEGLHVLVLLDLEKAEPFVLLLVSVVVLQAS